MMTLERDQYHLALLSSTGKLDHSLVVSSGVAVDMNENMPMEYVNALVIVTICTFLYKLCACVRACVYFYVGVYSHVCD